VASHNESIARALNLKRQWTRGSVSHQWIALSKLRDRLESGTANSRTISGNDVHVGSLSLGQAALSLIQGSSTIVNALNIAAR
jgi:hypothetical protein